MIKQVALQLASKAYADTKWALVHNMVKAGLLEYVEEKKEEEDKKEDTKEDKKEDKKKAPKYARVKVLAPDVQYDSKCEDIWVAPLQNYKSYSLYLSLSLNQKVLLSKNYVWLA